MNVRKEIQDFAEEMEKKMQEMDETKADSWRNVHIARLRGALDLEFKEWEKAVNDLGDGEETEELVDIANFCWMIHQRKENGE